MTLTQGHLSKVTAKIQAQTITTYCKLDLIMLRTIVVNDP